MTGMLKRKVIVVSGVGPGLGTTLAHRCARDGADLVLAARSAERLDDVAKQIIDTGRRAVAVRTDITDDDDVSNLVQATLAAYGKADVLINNAFRVPSMTGHRLRVASPSNRPVLLHRTLKVPHGGCGCRRGVTVR